MSWIKISKRDLKSSSGIMRDGILLLCKGIRLRTRRWRHGAAEAIGPGASRKGLHPQEHRVIYIEISREKNKLNWPWICPQVRRPSRVSFLRRCDIQTMQTRYNITVRSFHLSCFPIGKVRAYRFLNGKEWHEIDSYTNIRHMLKTIPPYNKQLVFGVASTNGSFSGAPQQTVRFRRRVNKHLVFGGALTNR